MNVIDAAHRIAHEYPGGAEALAPRMGIGAAVFRSKLNPHTETHHLTLRESVRLQQLAQRYDVLHAMADELGHIAIPLPSVPDGEMAHALARTCAEFGEYLGRIDQALTDGAVTPNELKHLEKELTEMVAQAAHMQSLLASMSRPRAVAK